MDKTIIQKELSFRTSRSSGSGGQHVNKTDTKVDLLFPVSASEGLSQREKNRIEQELHGRINQEGILQVSSGQRRSQHLNRKAAIQRFFKLLEKALRPRSKRKGPQEFRANPRKRVDQKKRRGEKKQRRKKLNPKDFK